MAGICETRYRYPQLSVSRQVGGRGVGGGYLVLTLFEHLIGPMQNYVSLYTSIVTRVADQDPDWIRIQSGQ
jgi:hypothetical protein